MQGSQSQVVSRTNKLSVLEVHDDDCKIAKDPLERTLLTTGLVAAGMQSLAAGSKRIETPHLAIRYEVPRASTFAQS